MRGPTLISLCTMLPRGPLATWQRPSLAEAAVATGVTPAPRSWAHWNAAAAVASCHRPERGTAPRPRAPISVSHQRGRPEPTQKLRGRRSCADWHHGPSLSHSNTRQVPRSAGPRKTSVHLHVLTAMFAVRVNPAEAVRRLDANPVAVSVASHGAHGGTVVSRRELGSRAPAPASLGLEFSAPRVRPASRAAASHGAPASRAASAIRARPQILVERMLTRGEAAISGGQMLAPSQELPLGNPSPIPSETQPRRQLRSSPCLPSRSATAAAVTATLQLCLQQL